MDQARGSILAGMAICWLLNVAQLGIGWLLLVADVRMLPAYYVMVGAIGLVQVGYVVPIWRLLRRKGKPRTAKGMLLAAVITLIFNVVLVMLGISAALTRWHCPVLRAGGSVQRASLILYCSYVVVRRSGDNQKISIQTSSHA